MQTLKELRRRVNPDMSRDARHCQPAQTCAVPAFVTPAQQMEIILTADEKQDIPTSHPCDLGYVP